MQNTTTEREAADIAKLSPAQRAALAKLTREWQSAYDMQCSLSTLRALVSKGFAVVRYGIGASFMPRSGIDFRLPPGRAARQESSAEEK